MTIQKSRGYAFEIRLQDYFNAINSLERESIFSNSDKTQFWNASRLAPSNVSMPDVAVTYKNNLFALEAKSTAAKSRTVKLVQIHNGNQLMKTFPLYKNRYVGICWYFMGKIKKIYNGEKIETKRQRKIFIAIWKHEDFTNFANSELYKQCKQIECNFNGTIRYRTNKTLANRSASIIDIMEENEITEKIQKQFPFKKFYNLEHFVNYYQHSNEMVTTLSPFDNNILYST